VLKAVVAHNDVGFRVLLQQRLRSRMTTASDEYRYSGGLVHQQRLIAYILAE
jgi:uncharacterized protein involved in type VI secretion and phage assembly